MYYKVYKTYRDGQKVYLRGNYIYKEAEEMVEKLEKTKKEKVTYGFKSIPDTLSKKS